jgi:hypothetical protein
MLLSCRPLIGRLCCVDGIRSGFAARRRGSDGTREFNEGNREPVPDVHIDSEFVVATAQILDECVFGTNHTRRAESFQATHRPQPPFAARCGVDTGSFQDRPHRAGRKLVAKASKFAVDPAVSPG